MKTEIIVITLVMLLSFQLGCLQEGIDELIPENKTEWATSGNITMELFLPEGDLDIFGTYNITIELTNSGERPVKIIPIGYYSPFGSLNIIDENGELLECKVDFSLPSPLTEEELVVIDPGRSIQKIIGYTNQYFRFREGREYTVFGQYICYDIMTDVPELWNGNVTSSSLTFKVKIDLSEREHLLDMLSGYEKANDFVDSRYEDPFLVEVRSRDNRRMTGSGEEWVYTFHIPSTLKNDTDPEVEDGYWAVDRVLVNVWKSEHWLILDWIEDRWLDDSPDIGDPNRTVDLSINSPYVIEFASNSEEMKWFRANYSDVWVKYIVGPVEWYVEISSHQYSPQLKDGAQIQMRYKPEYDLLRIQYDDLEDSAR